MRYGVASFLVVLFCFGVWIVIDTLISGKTAVEEKQCMVYSKGGECKASVEGLVLDFVTDYRCQEYNQYAKCWVTGDAAYSSKNEAELVVLFAWAARLVLGSLAIALACYGGYHLWMERQRETSPRSGI